MMNNASRLFFVLYFLRRSNGMKTNITWLPCEQIILDLCFRLFRNCFFLEVIKTEEHLQALKLNSKGGCKIKIFHKSELEKVNGFLFKSKFVLFCVCCLYR